MIALDSMLMGMTRLDHYVIVEDGRAIFITVVSSDGHSFSMYERMQAVIENAKYNQSILWAA